jgi:hypothetical protein
LTSFPDPTGTARKPYRRNRESWPTSNDTHLRRSRFSQRSLPNPNCQKTGGAFRAGTTRGITQA